MASYFCVISEKCFTSFQASYLGQSREKCATSFRAMNVSGELSRSDYGEVRLVVSGDERECKNLAYACKHATLAASTPRKVSQRYCTIG